VKAAEYVYSAGIESVNGFGISLLHFSQNLTLSFKVLNTNVRCSAVLLRSVSPHYCWTAIKRNGRARLGICRKQDMVGQTAKTFSSQEVHAPIHIEDSVIVMYNKLYYTKTPLTSTYKNSN
jgi:hypothetical protein